MTFAPFIEASVADRRPIRVALVNNMPDSAFIDTENQFRRAMRADSRSRGVSLELYTIAGIPRSEAIAAIIQAGYHGLDRLWADPPDVLIVTGTPPAQVHLECEPYWHYLARLLEWAANSVPVVLLSCLAAHASILLFDGIERVQRPSKCSGVFAGTVQGPGDDPITDGLPALVPMPHSRMNDVPQAALAEVGYQILVGCDGGSTGWSVATRQCGDALFVLCQGHPEYNTLSLLREYRRDVRRSLFGLGAVPYPWLPERYLSSDATAIMEEFARQAASPCWSAQELWATFPYDEVAPGVQNTWAEASSRFYANLLGVARRAARARNAVPAVV